MSNPTAQMNRGVGGDDGQSEGQSCEINYFPGTN